MVRWLGILVWTLRSSLHTYRELAVVAQQIVRPDDSADRWRTAQRAMAAVPIVVVQPAIQGGGALRRAMERRPVGPLAQQRTDETLGFAVRARGIGPCAAMRQAPRPAGGGEDARAIAGAIVGQHAVHPHAAPAKPGHGPAQKGGHARPVVVGQDFRVRHPRAIIDAHVDELPADAPRLAPPIAGDAMAHVPDAPQLLGIEMQQLAGLGPFVALNERAGVEGVMYAADG